MKKVYIYSSYERFWHWMQAALIFMLILTGFEINGAYKLFGYESATDIHNLTGISLIVLIIFTIFWHFTTGEWRQYIPTLKNIRAQVTYYTRGIFEGAPHPTRKTTLSKLNPLQRLAYLGLKLILMPTMVVTGIIYYLYRYPYGGEIQSLGIASIESVAQIHTFGAFVMIAFVIMHVYLTTTGHTPASNLKAMITGWEELALVLLLVMSLQLAGCGPSARMDTGAEDRFDLLIRYMEEEADFVNAPDTPFFINAPEVYANLKKNYLVIDIRSREDYENGHIEGSVHVPPNRIIAYLEEEIHAPGFERIVLVCPAGYESAYVAMAARYLGYSNVFPMRNGLSSWDHAIASEYRLRHISDVHSDKLVRTGFPMNEPGRFPPIHTTRSEGYDILRERIIDILSGDIGHRFVTVDDWMENSESWYLVSYWPERPYNRGHLPGAVRYQPKKSLRSGESLSTLPVGKPVVIQCFAGNHSNFVTMYLNILGYDARSMIYGANSFMYSIIKADEAPGAHFAAEKDIFHFPLVTDDGSLEPEPMDIPRPAAIPDGGC